MIFSKMWRFFKNVRLLHSHILVDGFVKVHNGIIIHDNWGDDLNYFFLKEVVEKPLLIYNMYSMAFRYSLRTYLIIGSTIEMLTKENTYVWGAGIIYGDRPLRCKPQKVYAVRGPLSRNVLINNGVDCPKIYGDPALLIPLYYQPTIEKKYKYGIIVHDIDTCGYRNITIDGILASSMDYVLMIDLSKYEKWTDIVDQVLSCESVISCSLHGIIISEAYKVPNVWVEFNEPLYGGRFKFHDFFSSIGRDREAPVFVEDNKIEMKQINENLKEWQAGHLDLTPLIKACPFKIKKAIYKQIF